jgi:aspartyl-tRNA(Asn)/glutamyl-tRNA(Gln) amidotransferase subunit C
VAQEFTSDDLKRVAELARIDLTPDEQALFGRQLSQFLAYARQVQEVETRGVAPTSHSTGVSTPLRPDATQGSLARDAALAGAPDADPSAGLFKVPRVLG